MTDIADIEPAQRLYTIQNDAYHYATGHLSNSNQVLMMGDGSDSGIPSFLRVEFNAQGDVVAVHREEPGDLSAASAMFMPGTICVKMFLISDIWFGIQDLPDHYQEFLDHPENTEEKERPDWMREVEDWRERKSFVLWCNEDFYLSEDGDLESF